MTTNDLGIAAGASLKPYPSYKDSGVEWLGEVPEHWEVRRLKHIAEVFPSNVDKHSKEDETPVRLCNYTDVYYNETIADDLDFMQATASDAQIEKFELRAGDTIITKDSETADDIAVPAFVPSDMPGVICGYHLSMIRPREGLFGAFVKRLFDSRYIKACVEVRANGLTRVGLGQYALDNLDIPTPPETEQTTIAAFLDHETAKIDALVEDQRRLIELLKEKRQAVISHAVTKGLNPDAPMKDSGVEWLGEVPEHWEVVPNKSMMTRCKELVGEKWSTTSLLSLTKKGVILRDIESGDGKYPADFGTYQEVATNDIVFCLFDIDETPCTVGIAKHDGMITGAYTVLRCHADSSPEYITYFYLHIDSFKGLRPFYTGLRKVVRPPTFMSIKMPRPPHAEQTAIATFIDDKKDKIDRLVSEAESVIILLQERRTALISAAVTGKIDVRNHAPTSEGVPA